MRDMETNLTTTMEDLFTKFMGKTNKLTGADTGGSND